MGENKIVEGGPSTPPHSNMPHVNATWYYTPRFGEIDQAFAGSVEDVALLAMHLAEA